MILKLFKTLFLTKVYQYTKSTLKCLKQAKINEIFEYRYHPST